MGFAPTAIPLIITRQSLFLAEVVYAVIERYPFASIFQFHITIGTEVYMFELGVFKGFQIGHRAGVPLNN
jgi:hypothetical protein